MEDYRQDDAYIYANKSGDDVYEHNKAFDNFTHQIQKTTESFENLKTLIDEAKNQIQKEKTDFVAKLLENK